MQPSGEPEKRMRRFTRRSRRGLCRAGGAKSIAGGPWSYRVCKIGDARPSWLALAVPNS